MTAVKISTPRLETDLDVLVNWSIDKDIEDSLRLLIDCTVIHDRIDLFTTIIDRLSTDNCIESLSKWSNSSSYSFHLYRLVFNFKTDPPKNFNKNIFSSLRPAKNQLFGELDFYYLVSAILERIPTGTPDQRQWFERFRLWLVVKAIRAASSQNLQDSYLRELFKYIRIAADKLTEKKLNLINKLMVDSNRYYFFTAEIERKAKQLIRDPTNKPNDINFLNILIKICNNNFNPEIYQLVQPIYSAVNYLPKVVDNRNLSNIESGQDGEGDHDEKLIEVSEEGEADIGVEADVDPNQPLQLKILNGNSVLLSSIVELQFLPWSWSTPSPIEMILLLKVNDQLLVSEKEDEQLIAMIVWMALKTGRSFRRTLNIQIAEIGEDWTLNIKEQKLVRKQPSRRISWLPKSQEDQSWIIPIVETHEINLTENISSIVNHHLSKFPHIKYLNQLWNEKEWGSAESCFLEKFRQMLPRLTPGMLGNFLPQKIFTATENDKLARILASHPNTGLPPASAYSAWLKNEHLQVFNQFLSSSQLDEKKDRKSTRLNSSHPRLSRMPSSA